MSRTLQFPDTMFERLNGAAASEGPEEWIARVWDGSIDRAIDRVHNG